MRNRNANVASPRLLREVIEIDPVRRSRMHKLKCVIAVIAAVIILALGWTGYSLRGLFVQPRPTNRSYLWYFNSIYVLMESGSPVAYKLKSKEGGVLEGNIPFHVWNGGLVYWSEVDASLALIRHRKNDDWFPVPKSTMMPDWRVRSVLTSGDSVLLNLKTTDERPIAVLALDTSDRRWTRLEGVLEVRVDTADGSDRIVVLTKDFELVITSLSTGSEAKPLGKIDEFVDWDYDFTSGTLFYLSADHRPTMRLATGEERRLKLPNRYVAKGITWQRVCNEIWIPVSVPFSFSGFVVYSADGRFLGSVENCLGRYERLQAATGRMAELLSASGLDRTALTWEDVCGHERSD